MTGLSASRTCVLPNMGYSDDSDAAKYQQGGMDVNIGASHGKGSLLTFSFQVIQQDEIRCYLYWNGSMIRFMPNDVKTTLPQIFNMDWCAGKNIEFLNMQSKDHSIENMIGKMTDILQDKKFTAFQAWCNDLQQ